MSKIQPALTAEEWAAMSAPFAGDIIVSAIGQSVPGMLLSEYRATQAARIVALANAALPDDDLRKFTWEDVDTLREFVAYQAANGEHDEKLGDGPNPMGTIADRIEALLPPR